MSTSSSAAWQPSAPRAEFRFGHESRGEGGPAGWSIDWLLKRNCSMAPRQLLAFYLSLCVLSLGIAAMFWFQGARMIMTFAWIELSAVGLALWVVARHATDSESIVLRNDRLTVEVANGQQVERVEFQPAWVRVEPAHGDQSLIELSGQGRRISVGRFVRPELRSQLAQELRHALRRWQQGAARPSPV
jgi:uncharacterized membrane protein